MRRLWSRLQSTSLPSLILIAVIFAVGITMWALGPSEGNKYSDLGINLGVGAVLGVAVLYVEAVVGRAEAERERRLAEEQRFVQTLIAAADLTEIRIPGRSLTGIILAARDLSGGDLSSTDLTRADRFRCRRSESAWCDGRRAPGEKRGLDGREPLPSLRLGCGLHGCANH
jgi:hypothetical protein